MLRFCSGRACVFTRVLHMKPLFRAMRLTSSVHALAYPRAVRMIPHVDIRHINFVVRAVFSS